MNNLKQFNNNRHKLERKIIKTGHLLSMYIPNSIVRELNLSKGETVLISLINGKIIVEKIDKGE
jgi:antitoxin component of MazEF toxin-antitoxin module